MLPAPLATTLIVTPWNDPVVEAVGFDARSAYVELFWLGILGPTATWMLRRLVSGLDAYPDGYELDLSETANALGLSLTAGTHSPFGRALNRNVMFGMAHEVPGGIAVRRQIPPLSLRHLRKLPPHLQAAHGDWVGARPNDEQTLGRAIELANVMVRVGDEPHQVERQLLSVGVAPREAKAAARQCVSV
ncbi:MAG TPA: hypothetical protein VGM78_08685 [Ilumatobacteraceae bacterium]|jgi:hypothetical protein